MTPEQRDAALVATAYTAEAQRALLARAVHGEGDLDAAETVEMLAAATLFTIRILDPDATDEDKCQLAGALDRYLDGWPG